MVNNSFSEYVRKTNSSNPRINKEWGDNKEFIPFATMAAHLCNFIKKTDHRPCEVAVGPNGPNGEHALCGIHAPIKARLPPLAVGGCEHIIGDHWCPRHPVAGERLCPNHVAMREREAVVRVAEREAAAARRLVDVAAAEAWRAGERERWRVEAERAANPPPGLPAPLRAVGLQRLALDRQNVHTAAVVRHTNAGEEKLLAVRTDGRPVGLRVLRVFAARGGSLAGVLRVANDVDHWYNQGTCRTIGDRLYARCLEGLWTLIEQQPEEVRGELKARLWEEASESVGMCCEGHLARLVNVMAGFDDTFKPRVSTGEAIQSKIAAIAGMEVSTEEKVALARTFLTELAVPAAEQTPWLDALA
jgi:hypothetical protein